MKHAAITARKIKKDKIAWNVQRGEKPFCGAQGPNGPKDPKDLRGSKGALLNEAEALAEGEERYPG
jgi:hypothetical protein